MKPQGVSGAHVMGSGEVLDSGQPGLLAPFRAAVAFSPPLGLPPHLHATCLWLPEDAQEMAMIITLCQVLAGSMVTWCLW